MFSLELIIREFNSPTDNKDLQTLVAQCSKGIFYFVSYPKYV